MRPKSMTQAKYLKPVHEHSQTDIGDRELIAAQPIAR